MTPFLPAGTPSVTRCGSCAVVTTDPLADACNGCGGLLEVAHAEPMVRGPGLADRLAANLAVRSGVWRFGQLVMPGAATPVTWPEGNTPLVEREAIREYAGVARVHVKHEGLNPTGSFKDRGMTVALTRAVQVGARAVACASTGNTAASLAAYAAQAGIPALVLVPRGQVAAGKLAQAAAYGARTLVVDADFDACLDLARRASRELGVYLANSVNPWRLEGQKTIAWEMLAQLDWQPPDWIAVPAGALGNVSALGKALREARELGLIARVPRLLAVQAAGAAPFATAFANGFRDRISVRAETVATAIRIGAPASWDRAVRAVTETRGAALAVSDDEILDAKAVIDAAGVGCEPASAASLAGTRAACKLGTISPHETVACILTGHLLKDPDSTAAFHAGPSRRANAPVPIPAEVSALERFVSRT